ncbi:MAG: hypothetical protein ACTSQP_00735 [Promethearchaeota archaeon]
MLEKYENIAGFNLEGYFIKYLGGIKVMEFIPTVEEFEGLKADKTYLGVCFIVDNIEKKIWVFQDDEIKTKKYVKSIKTEKKDKKLTELTKRIFEDELNYDISSYTVHRAKDNLGLFNKLFKYQINEYPLYKKHYLLPQYEYEEEEKEIQETVKEELSANVQKCANCGWLISANLTVCPKCHRSPREKFEGKKET